MLYPLSYEGGRRQDSRGPNRAEPVSGRLRLVGTMPG